MWKNLLLLIMAGLVWGCSHKAGFKYDTTAVDRIEVGQTPESQVVAMLGQPLSQQRFGNGTTMYRYTYGNKCPVEGTYIDTLQVRVYNGVVISKWQDLMAE
jgi:outer membrane protein assembly factor BamE (lipoprotein component of BamABCDE complex)